MYSIEIERNAEKFLKKLDKKESGIILNKIYSIRENPFRFVTKLQGEKLWKLRTGDYRTKIDIIISNKKITVIRIGHRKNVYKK